jgi:hypothetical protein
VFHYFEHIVFLKLKLGIKESVGLVEDYSKSEAK